MRLLVTIPHYCRRTPNGPGFYGSEKGDIATRRAQVEQCILTLHQTFGPRQALLTHTVPVQANRDFATVIDVVLVTAGDDHLADDLPREFFIQVATDAEPRLLGFKCHELMRDNAERYDYFAYLEDDIEIVDPMFFDKLGWFSEVFGQSALLQPNRFERAPDLHIMKLYVDGNTTSPDLPGRFQDISVRPRLVGGAFGRRYEFQRVNNVHSGCFFLNATQLNRVAASPMFGQPNADFFGPLESAATLMIMRAFEVYKPARENAAFLEIHHLGRRFLMGHPGAPDPVPEAAQPEPPAPETPAPETPGPETPAPEIPVPEPVSEASPAP